MTKMIFVNLPVADLPKSMAFYEALGFVNEPRFTDHTAAAMQWSDTIVVMLLTHDKWKSFTTKTIPNAKESAQVSLAINLDSREEVDAITETAGRNGGTADSSPPQDYGFMYQRSFEDPDGHGWEPLWMDPKVATGEMPVEHVEA
jgi:predicted lactoylglutathione lyase